jgi:HEAT repeat protein
MVRRVSHPPEALALAVADPGFTPGKHDLAAVIDLLGADEAVAEHAERALLRASGAGLALQRRLTGSVAPLRARIVKVIGRLAVADEALRGPLLACLRDEDPKARRNAIVALGKLEPPASAALVEHARVETSVPHLRSLAEALGKCGDPRRWRGSMGSRTRPGAAAPAGAGPADVAAEPGARADGGGHRR